MPYFYDITPGNKVPEQTAAKLSEWITTMCSGSVTAHLVLDEPGARIKGAEHSRVKQRIKFESEDDRNLFALYVSGLDLTKK